MNDASQSNQKSGSYFQRHIFFCQNQRAANDPRGDCARCFAGDAFDYVKGQSHALGLLGVGRVRVNKAGCLDRCEHGPVCVVYPEGVWYQYVDREDLDDIITQHLQNGVVVERLRIKEA